MSQVIPGLPPGATPAQAQQYAMLLTQYWQAIYSGNAQSAQLAYQQLCQLVAPSMQNSSWLVGLIPIVRSALGYLGMAASQVMGICAYLARIAAGAVLAVLTPGELAFVLGCILLALLYTFLMQRFYNKIDAAKAQAALNNPTYGPVWPIENRRLQQGIVVQTV
ncbi:MAG: hypothetical protein KF708_00515 [Pirellulales bacterium]|nr:hypothetical protein [Pirellulales bacterium]